MAQNVTFFDTRTEISDSRDESAKNTVNNPPPYNDVYLYKNHPGTYVKKKSLWVTNVREIRGERLNEFGDWEFYLIGDDMDAFDWVPLERIHAQDKIVEFRKKRTDSDKSAAVRYDPLPFGEFCDRDNRIIVRTKPVEILYSISNKKGDKFYVVHDEEERRVIMAQKDVEEQHPNLHREYLSRIFGFEIN